MDDFTRRNDMRIAGQFIVCRVQGRGLLALMIKKLGL